MTERDAQLGISSKHISGIFVRIRIGLSKCLHRRSLAGHIGNRLFARRTSGRALLKYRDLRLLGAALGTAALGSYVLHHYLHYRAESYASRVRALQPSLGAWHQALEADKARIAAERRAGEAALARVAGQLAAVQTRIVELDALARGVLESDAPASSDIDFDEEPALGGPEDVSEDASNESRGGETRLETDAALLAAQVDDRARQLHVLADLLEWRAHLSAVRPEGRPIAGGYVSSSFGERIDPFTGRKQQHFGMDFAARRGTEVVAVADGVVTWTGPRGGYGKLVEIDHGNGRVTRYGHNSEVLVHVGQVVRRGERIAKLGSTGRATGPNLHFEVRENGKAVDPRPFVNGRQLVVKARRGKERSESAVASRSRGSAGTPASPRQVAESEAHGKGQRRQVAALVVEPDAEVLKKVPAHSRVDHGAVLEAPGVERDAADGTSAAARVHLE
jgi:murein DD-endopeptidase MepM/ murein hydrolase activator NlpD